MYVTIHVRSIHVRNDMNPPKGPTQATAYCSTGHAGMENTSRLRFFFAKIITADYLIPMSGIFILLAKLDYNLSRHVLTLSLTRLTSDLPSAETVCSVLG